MVERRRELLHRHNEHKEAQLQMKLVWVGIMLLH